MGYTNAGGDLEDKHGRKKSEEMLVRWVATARDTFVYADTRTREHANT